MRGSSDLDVAARASSDDRVLITEDYDFGELVVRHGVRLPGLVILAMPNEPGLVRKERILELTTRLGDSLRGQFTIVELKRERLRPLVLD
jgi:predicted nuclease of predicted toxin-antitoxin system